MSETAFWKMGGNGGHTAFLDCVDLMRGHPELDVHVNSLRPCDVLHSHSWGPAYFLRGLAYPGRRILTAHALPETAEGAVPLGGTWSRRIVREYLRAVYDFSSVVIAVAPRTAELLEAHGVRSAVRILSNPVRMGQFYPSGSLRNEGRRLLGLDDQRPVVLGVGQLQPRKGIREFAQIAEAMPGVRFIWVGGRPFGRLSAGLAEIDGLMARPPANLTFAGLFDLTRMPAIYNAADALLFPSWHELSPYVPLEAAACGIPVILRDLPEYRSLYPSGYLAASDRDEFVARLRRVLSDPLERRCARVISADMAARFQPQRFVQSLTELYDAVACGEIRSTSSRSVAVTS
jgi:1,2-diacylglycerol-3-alpha-glucose alpha-1,2-galactosyltransferase